MIYYTFTNMMHVHIYWIGKTGKSFIEEGLDLYNKRIQHYAKFSIIELKDIKNKAKLDPIALKEKEAALILSKIDSKSFLVLLDEKGKSFSSRKFAEKLESLQQQSLSSVSFLIGGAYGVDQIIRKRANLILSFSEMTFSHQFIRLILFEQLYRAFTIIKGEKYHND